MLGWGDLFCKAHLDRLATDRNWDSDHGEPVTVESPAPGQNIYIISSRVQGTLQREQKDCKGQRIEGVGALYLLELTWLCGWGAQSSCLRKTCMLSKGIGEGRRRIGKKTVEVGGGKRVDWGGEYGNSIYIKLLKLKKYKSEGGAWGTSVVSCCQA